MLLKVLVGLSATVVYCVLAHVASTMSSPGVWAVALALFWVAIVSLGMAWRAQWRGAALLAWGVAFVCIAWASPWLAAHARWLFFVEHASMQALMCVGFARSLAPGQVPMISQFAVVMRGELTPAVARYTRSLTWVWATYFGASVVVSVALFVWAPVGWWSVFSNLLGLPLMAAIFAGDHVARKWFLPTEQHGGVLQALQAYRRVGAGVRPLH